MGGEAGWLLWDHTSDIPTGWRGWDTRGTLNPEAGVTSRVMKWLLCLSHGPGGQVSLFVFNLAEIIGWLKDSFAGRDLLNSHTNLLVSLSFSYNLSSHLQD